MEMKIIGKKTFGPVIDITDPCYGKDVWCRLNDICITPGDYTCIAYLSDEGEWGVRCLRAGIYLENADFNCKCRKEIGLIGVDAGLAGFFENKPDYSDEEWSDFCNKTFEKDPVTGKTPEAWIFKEGFFTSSGYGDGCYTVYEIKNAGIVVGYEIDFD